MTYVPATLKVEVGLSSGPVGPGVALTAGSWTDLSSRVREFDMTRGRTNETAEFEAGTITVLLDNHDRMLDPDYASSLVYRGSDLGLPLCPVRITADYLGSNYPVFYGFVGPEAWIVDRAPHGTESVCTLQAFDSLAVFALVDLPSSPFAAAVKALDPSYWNRGDSNKPVLSDGDTMPAFQFVSGTTTVRDSGGGETVSVAGGLAVSDSGTALACQAGAYVDADPPSMFGAFTSTTAMTASVIWKSPTLAGDAGIIRLTESPSGDHRWRVYCNNSGNVVLVMYDNAGASISFTAAPSNPSGGRWDDDNAHIVMVRYVASSELAVWVDGHKAQITVSVPAHYDVAELFVGATNYPVTVDEVVVWGTDAVSTTNLGHLWSCHLGTAQPFHHDQWEDRIARWYQIAGWAIDGSESSEWQSEVLAGASRDQWGLGSVNTMPTDLIEALRQAAGSGIGVVWATRSGRVRVRTMGALTDPGWFHEYDDPIAELTDAVSPSGSPRTVRRGVVAKTGVRMDRIINRAEVTYGIDGGANIPTPVAPVVMAATDPTSEARYGTRIASYTTDWIDGDTVTAFPAAIVARWKTPPVEVRDLTIDVWGHTDETAFVIEDLELEKLVTVIDTPPVGSAWAADLNIQGEVWSWVNGVSWTVTLSLAES